MKSKITATIVTGILVLGATAGWAADKLQTRTRTPGSSSTCTGTGTGAGSMVRTNGGR